MTLPRPLTLILKLAAIAIVGTAIALGLFYPIALLF